MLRGQSSMEYVMTYGWAVLVVMIIGVAMWQAGIFNTSPSSVNILGFAKIKPQVAGTGLTAGPIGEFKGTFTNAFGGKIILTAVRIKNHNTGVIICCSHAAAHPTDCVNPTTINIAGRDTIATFTGNPPRIASGDSFSLYLKPCTITGAKQGEAYDIQIEMDYNSISGKYLLPHTEVGELRGPFE